MATMTIPHLQLLFQDQTTHHRYGNFNFKDRPISTSFTSMKSSHGAPLQPGNAASRRFIHCVSSEKKPLITFPGPESKNEPEDKLASAWEEFHGKNDRISTIDPIDPPLRTEIIRYGEMAQACYDAFDADPFSKYCGSCRYGMSNFFQSVGLPHLRYEVTRYLYASCNINHHPHFFRKSLWPKGWGESANWIGFIAVSDDQVSKLQGRRDVAIVWRGTMTRPEMIADAMYSLRPISQDRIPCPDSEVKVESGFLHMYTERDENSKLCKHSAREHALEEVKRLIKKYANENLSITVTGHSLGSALAILSAYDIAETRVDKRPDGRPVPKCVFSFSGPRVGNRRFRERVEELGVKVLRVVNVHDKVPTVPGVFLNENTPPLMQFLPCYWHIGVELALDHRNSPFLKNKTDLTCFHDLELLMHLLDGYKGKGQKFELTSGRDIALVNKASDFLKDEFLVPPKWMQLENKGLTRSPDGRWVQPERQDFGDNLEE